MPQQSQSPAQASDLERGSDLNQGRNPQDGNSQHGNSQHGNSQGGNSQGNSDKSLSCDDRLPLSLKKPLDWFSTTFDIESNWGLGLYITAYMIVILIHPLHYYAYVIKPDQNCLEIDNEVYATIVVVVVIFSNAYMLLYTPGFFKKIIACDHRPETAIKHFIFTQIPVMFMTLTLLPDLTAGTTDKIFLTTANLFLFGYILLVIGLSFTLKKATQGNAFIARTKMTGAVYNLLLYLLGGHVYGALWYSFAIDRILGCWREDYFARNKFNPHSFVCRDKHTNIGELNCSKIKNNAGDITGFGIFDDALKSRIVDLKGQFLKKILYCFRWGLQALSCFGQNLSPSTFIMENIFVVSIVIYSTVLFVFFIGNMQEYLKSEDRSEEMTLFEVQEPEQSTLKQKQTVEQYVSFQKLPQELQMEMKNNLQLNKWRESKILHKDLLRDIKIELCLPQLRKVEEFTKLKEPEWKDLCYKVKLVFYRVGTRIVQEKDPINEILFVLHGVLQTDTGNYLKDGEFFGKELVTWCINQARTIPPALPTHPRTVKTITNVEAFVLTAYDLKKILIEHNQQQAN